MNGLKTTGNFSSLQTKLAEYYTMIPHEVLYEDFAVNQNSLAYNWIKKPL